MGVGAPDSFELVGPQSRTPNTSPTESVTRSGAPPLQVGRGSSAAPRVPLLILGKSRLCYHPRSSQGTKCQLQSGGEGDTALSDGSQYGIGIHASDHMVVIITARIR
jgi:hypothetical protein